MGYEPVRTSSGPITSIVALTLGFKDSTLEGTEEDLECHDIPLQLGSVLRSLIRASYDTRHLRLYQPRSTDLHADISSNSIQVCLFR